MSNIKVIGKIGNFTTIKAEREKGTLFLYPEAKGYLIHELSNGKDLNEVNSNSELNLPSQIPFHASKMLSKNISKLIQEFIQADQIYNDMDNEIVKGCLVTHKGDIIQKMTKKIIVGD